MWVSLAERRTERAASLTVGHHRRSAACGHERVRDMVRVRVLGIGL